MNKNRPYSRVERVGNQILDILSGILTKYIDLSHLGFITFTNVDIAPDLRSAKVYYSVLNRKKTDQDIYIAINQKRKAFKKYMGPELQIKSIPDLHFYHDKSLIYEDQLNKILHDIDIPKKDNDTKYS
ncbi:MAG: ribosome-binding factor A [Candidatus Marinimicrobia bacterium]|nr:ribosome-binding factor A [Candidatus Neomarinimicrobiota bacterium]